MSILHLTALISCKKSCLSAQESPGVDGYRLGQHSSGGKREVTFTEVLPSVSHFSFFNVSMLLFYSFPSFFF